MPRRTQREKPENTAARPLLFDERAVSSRALRIESVIASAYMMTVPDDVRSRLDSTVLLVALCRQ